MLARLALGLPLGATSLFRIDRGAVAGASGRVVGCGTAR